MSVIKKSVQALSLTALMGFGVLTYTSTKVVPSAYAQADKMTICHGAGQDGTTKFVTLTLSTNAVYQDQGNGGHFYENGTPKAGHEQDYVGECKTESSPSASPSVSPSAEPSVSPSASPSVSPSVSPSSTPASSNNNSSNNSSNGGNSDSGTGGSNVAEGEVLGAYAETGVVEDAIMNALGYVGGLMTMTGSLLYGKKKSKYTI
jgi:hypothetical protein